MIYLHSVGVHDIESHNFGKFGIVVGEGTRCSQVIGNYHTAGNISSVEIGFEGEGELDNAHIGAVACNDESTFARIFDEVGNSGFKIAVGGVFAENGDIFIGIGNFICQSTFGGTFEAVDGISGKFGTVIGMFICKGDSLNISCIAESGEPGNGIIYGENFTA